jgi:hypothetical protein
MQIEIRVSIRGPGKPSIRIKTTGGSGMRRRVEFSLRVEAQDGGGLFRRVELVPYVPFAGFWVAFTTTDESRQIERAAWQGAKNLFRCRLRAERHPEEDWQAVKARYQGEGWRLAEERLRVRPVLPLADYQGEG